MGKTLTQDSPSEWRKEGSQVSTDGRREVIGLAVGPSEAEPFWAKFLRPLTSRRLRGVKLVISDAHEGLKAAAKKLFGATWQRCRVHFRRNAMAHVGVKQRAMVSAAISTAFPKEHWPQLHSTNPIERLNREVKRRTNVVAIFPNGDAIIRLVGALMLEQNDEWAVCRRYMSLETLAGLSDDPAVRSKAIQAA